MPQSRFNINGTFGGMSMSCSIIRESTGQHSHEVEVGPAVAGQLTTRTDNDTGVITDAAHGVPDSSKVDVYWTGGARYGMTTSGATSDTFAIDGGSGDNLPADESSLTYMIQQVITCPFDGDDALVMAAKLESVGRFAFVDGSSNVLLSVELSENEIWEWHSDGQGANPMASAADVATVVVSHGQLTAQTFRLGILYDSTP